jgi:hypothetical protein
MDKSWNNTDIQWAATPRPDDVPNMLIPRLPVTGDGSGFYTIGGWQSSVTAAPVPKNDKLWKFVVNGTDPSTGTWETEDIAGDSTQMLRRTNENAIASSSRKIYDLGGSVGGLSDAYGGSQWRPSPYLRIFDLDEKKWTLQATPWGSAALTGASAVFSDKWGAEGVLVVFGGELVSQPYTDRTGRAEVDSGFGDVRVYNAATGKWFIQATTGEVPTRRQGTCVVSEWSEADQTLEM